MPLTLHPMTPSDGLSFTRIRAAAWAGPTYDMLHTGPLSESSIRGLAENNSREVGTPNMWHWKIVDTDIPPSEDDPKDGGGRTIAVAVWSLCNADEKESNDDVAKDVHSHAGNEKDPKNSQEKEPEPEKREAQLFVPPELRQDVRTALIAPFQPTRLSVMGTSTPYLMLNMLATHPSHQTRGAGTLLLDWGLRKADREGLRIYVDSKKMARTVYERRGFRLVREMVFDRGAWGGEGVDWHGCMVRER